MANARSLRVGDKGTVFVGSRLGDKVYAIVNKDGKREVKVLASGLYRPNGLAFKDGTLYIAELSKISKIEKVEDNLDNPPKPTVIYDKLPKDEAHGWKFIGIGPDNKLYVPVGQPGNNVLHDDDHGQIRRINLDGTGAEVIATACATRSASTGIREPSSSTSPTTAATGCRKTCPRTSSTASPRSASISASPYCHQGNIADPRIRLGPLLQRLHAAGRPARPAFGVARHALLHRQHVPEELQERDLHRPARLVEQVEEVRRRRRRRQAEQGRHGEIDRSRSSPASWRTTNTSAARSTCC